MAHGNRKPPEQFEKEIKEKYGNEYTLLEKYRNANTKILVEHNKCNYKWQVYPGNLILGKSKCPKCSKRMKLNTQTFQEKLHKVLDSNYTIIGEYINDRSYVNIVHEVCGYIWNIAPNTIFTHRVECPRCQNKERYTTEVFSKKVFDLTDGEYALKSEYINNRIDIEIEHITCSSYFKTLPTSFLYLEKRCPLCTNSSSKGERKINEFLTSRDIDFEMQFTFNDCKYINLLRFDFAIKKDNKVVGLIEYDGEQHFESIDFFGGEKGFKELQKRDQIKNKYCKNNNIPLYRIPYWKFDEIEQILNMIINNKPIEVDETSFLVN